MSRALLAAMVLALALSACGRKGDLKPPPEYERDAPAEEAV